MITIGTTREGGGQRDVPGGALLDVDDLAEDQRRRADDLRHDVVAERQREGEDRAGDDAGQRQRQDHRPEGLARAGAEIVGRLDQRQRARAPAPPAPAAP